MALSRALESRKPADERICFDPYAERMLSLRYTVLLAARPLRDLAERIIEGLFPGHHYYVIARTRHIDEFLQQEIRRGFDQLVILGAGYDSRAYRFIDQLGPIKVFEVDFPATSDAKRARMRSLLGAPPANVVYVPVNFNADSLGERLQACGYQDRLKTVFLWEGVTPYVQAGGVDDVLRFIASSGAAGSSILFDYVLKSVINGRCDLRGARNEFDKMKRTDEPFVFGIDEQQVRAFLAHRGYGEITDVGSDELRQQYFGRFAGSRYVKPWWRIVHARLP